MMPRKRIHLTMLGTLLAAVAIAVSATTASANVYTVDSCALSASQSRSGWSNGSTAGFSGGLPYFYDAIDCSSYGFYRRVENNGAPGGANDWFTFAAPADTFITQAKLFQAITLRTSGAYDAVIAEQEDGARATVANYTSGSVGDTLYDMPRGGAHTVRLRTEVGCHISQLMCSGLSSDGLYGNVWQLSGAWIYLMDPLLPTFASVGGEGWQATPVDGVDTVTYAVADKGAGVQSVHFFVDGVEHAVDNSSCTTGAIVPCPRAVTGDFALDTTKLSEGAHTIAMTVADGSGGSTAASDKQLTITVRRAPTPATASPVTTSNPGSGASNAPAVGDHLTGSNGGWNGEGITYTYGWQRCDAQGQNCVPIAGANGLTYTPTSEDVGRTLQLCVTATNSGGSATSCSTPTAPVIAAHPSTSTGSDRTSDASPTSVGGPPTTPAPPRTGATTTPLGDRGAPNGSGASEKVVLTAVANSRTSTQKVKFGKRVPISGRLVGPNGAPISGALLAVQVQTAIPGASMADAAQVTTHADGRFSYLAPVGPSRVIRFGYRAYSADTSFADTTDVRLLVSAGVTLKATPKRLRNRKATMFRGRLLGKPIAKRGVVVDLQVFFRKQWRTFAAPRTNKAGAFKFKYRFMAGAATWRFRARVRRETSYPFELGLSLRPVTVKVVP